MGNIQGKIWGDTSILIQNSNVEVHKIHANAGFRCSEHKHAHKWNAFYVEKGVLEIHIKKNDYALTDITTLRAGDFTSVRPGEYHFFLCREDCTALEIYWPEPLSEDIQRRDHGQNVTSLSDSVAKNVEANTFMITSTPTKITNPDGTVTTEFNTFTINRT